jgi:sodium/potassium-transporting ATPase subunit alpha
MKFATDKQNFPTDNLCFLGVAAIMDPPRDDALGAIEACKAAGIKVFMVTGMIFSIILENYKTIGF